MLKPHKKALKYYSRRQNVTRGTKQNASEVNSTENLSNLNLSQYLVNGTKSKSYVREQKAGILIIKGNNYLQVTRTGQQKAENDTSHSSEGAVEPRYDVQRHYNDQAKHYNALNNLHNISNSSKK